MPIGTFTAVLRKERDLYVAECPEVGTVSQGKTVEEAVANLKEATELYLEEFPPRPVPAVRLSPYSRRAMPGLPAYQGQKRYVLLSDWASLRSGNAEVTYP